MRDLTRTLKDATDYLNQNHIELASLDARLIVAHCLEMTPLELITEYDQLVSPEQQDQIQAYLNRRIAYEPIASLFGEKEFWSLSFKVTDDTLCPRPDSETLIEQIIKDYPDHNSPLKILDLGTGTGCLLLTLLYEYPHARGVGLDASTAALKVAQFNQERHNLRERSTLLQSNWTSALEADQEFDIIICNPPYIPLRDKDTLAPEVTKHDPHQALFAGEDGLDDYRLLSQQLHHHLKAGGHIYLEIGYDQADAVSQIFKQVKGCQIDVYKDLAAQDRCLRIQY